MTRFLCGLVFDFLFPPCYFCLLLTVSLPGESSFCPKATCCRARDDNSLEKFAALTFADGMRMAVSGSLYELKRLSSRLSGKSS